MKIYFAGSHSIGKSTCARYVSEKYHLPMITECARMILSEKELSLDSLRSDLKVVNEYQEDIFYRQLDEEQKLYDDFVSDRTLDCLAYAGNHSTVLPKLIKSDRFNNYLNILNSPDSIVFFIRPSKATLKQDGVRESLSWDGVVTIDAQVKLLLEMFDIRHFQINTDNMQERARLIDSVLSLHYNKNKS